VVNKPPHSKGGITAQAKALISVGLKGNVLVFKPFFNKMKRGIIEAFFWLELGCPEYGWITQ